MCIYMYIFIVKYIYTCIYIYICVSVCCRLFVCIAVGGAHDTCSTFWVKGVNNHFEYPKHEAFHSSAQ